MLTTSNTQRRPARSEAVLYASFSATTCLRTVSSDASPMPVPSSATTTCTYVGMLYARGPGASCRAASLAAYTAWRYSSCASLGAAGGTVPHLGWRRARRVVAAASARRHGWRGRMQACMHAGASPRHVAAHLRPLNDSRLRRRPLTSSTRSQAGVLCSPHACTAVSIEASRMAAHSMHVLHLQVCMSGVLRVRSQWASAGPCVRAGVELGRARCGSRPGATNATVEALKQRPPGGAAQPAAFPRGCQLVPANAASPAAPKYARRGRMIGPELLAERAGAWLAGSLLWPAAPGGHAEAHGRQLPDGCAGTPKILVARPTFLSSAAVRWRLL